MNLKFLGVFIGLLLLSGITFNINGKAVDGSSIIAHQSKTYSVELDKWNIYNDSTNPIETTKGFNEALKWASEQGYTTFHVPAGVYLIDKDSRIEMVSGMTFLLNEGAVLQKEANSKERYELMYIGPGINNVTLKGGTYKGDKDTHNYSQKETPYTAGTHEGGYGIMTQAANNVTLDGVKAVNFTGDGICICATGSLIDDYYEGDFESGSIDSNGKLVDDKTKIRLTNLNVKAPLFEVQRNFQFLHGENLPTNYDVYFYKEDGTFISSLKKNIVGWGLVDIPEEANYFHVVFDASSTKGVYLEYWVQAVSKNVEVKNSEIAFNRRQGITVGGARDVLIEKNIIHDIKGTMPQSGIDVEAGYRLNDRIKINDNHFYNNKAYDVILFDGSNATVEGNLFASKGAIGLAISEPFYKAKIRDNRFEGTKIYAYRYAQFKGNVMKDSMASFFGPNVKIDGMTFYDTQVNINSTEPFGVEVSNITLHHNKTRHSGLNINKQPVHLKNVTSIGEPLLRAISGPGADETVFENLKVKGYNSTYGLDLPKGTYNNCEFQVAEGGKGGIQLNDEGRYVFNSCTIKTNKQGGGGISIYNKKAEVAISGSNIEQIGDTGTIGVQSAKKVEIIDNNFKSNNMDRKDVAVIKIGDYWDRNKPNTIHEVTIKGNTIQSNIEVNGISTIFAGQGAPPYIIENNNLYIAKLALKNNDRDRYNRVSN